MSGNINTTCWARNRMNTPKMSREKMKALLIATLCDGRAPKEIAPEFGIHPSTVSRIARGADNITMRAEIIKELRSEGRTVVLK